ncbi:hypothetical protein EU99_0564 [Prochlorococcus marinus str. MIT 9321]|uniref:Uncharacterized protein n=1 Tax=Prochlorococcus marinus str. MIT 9401 TaxID=167551 RepID=A0A0A2B2Z6_PROMR|nr:hypothetical protein EU99_0564 [Prochlorococcus marinus str. MIT 9321]KGG04314.1 hypothetical protein EV00_1343 [Prochlorococcus marinus str. MIT 9322]KGG06994.1 hypothetical protein EV01_1328 [Prochlorococcus marinus str. MIT 9401]
MIIKNNTKNLFITLSLLLILPLVQKQWFNLYSFNINDISFYSILYYLSGTICPSLVCLNSLKNYTYYNFNKNNIQNKNIIYGKILLFLVVTNLIFLSYFIADYLYINFDLMCNLFLEGINLPKPDILQLSFFIFLSSILLIFKKSRFLLKKLILINFILISLYLWHLQINNINVDDQLHIYRYFGLNDLNLINIFILIVIEISFFTWSFLSYKTNLSDWIVQKPQKGDITPILNMLFFYFFIIIYYTILT